MVKKIPSQKSLEESVLQVLATPGYAPMTFRQMRHALNCPKHLVGELMETLEAMAQRGTIKFGHRDTIHAVRKAPAPLPREGKEWKQVKEDGPTWEETKRRIEEMQEMPGPFAQALLNRIGRLAEPSEAEMAGRRDCRKDEVYTIDPADARDHDDAVCVRNLPGRKWQLDVHIADVSHYVEDGSALDKEALKRSFTNYLPWRAVPMLPEQLSTDLCSLLEGRDRLALSCRMVIGAKGEILSWEFFESVINVRRFLTYEEAQRIGDAGDPAMGRLKACTDALRKAREKENLLSFDVPESRIQFDAKGEPCGVKPSVHLPSHSWIEECMLAANRCCARQVDERKLCGLYRVHEAPELETIASIASWADALGKDVSAPPRMAAEGFSNVQPELQAWLADLLKTEGLPLGLQTKIIRCMKKARYSTECMGHFALGWRHYSHYTSPIRRYADLWTHRVLKANLHGTEPGVAWPTASRQIATHISAREEVVMKTERSTTRSCVAWTLRDRAGDQFEATVTGVEPMGVFVQVKDPYAEGMIHVRNMQCDFFEHNPDRMELVGMRTKRTLGMGDLLQVTLLKADPLAGFIDFALAEDESAFEQFRIRDQKRQQKREREVKKGRATRKLHPATSASAPSNNPKDRRAKGRGRKR
jgi:ribonuclease R